MGSSSSRRGSQGAGPHPARVPFTVSRNRLSALTHAIARRGADANRITLRNNTKVLGSVRSDGYQSQRAPPRSGSAGDGGGATGGDGSPAGVVPAASAGLARAMGVAAKNPRRDRPLDSVFGDMGVANTLQRVIGRVVIAPMDQAWLSWQNFAGLPSRTLNAARRQAPHLKEGPTTIVKTAFLADAFADESNRGDLISHAKGDAAF